MNTKGRRKKPLLYTDKSAILQTPTPNQFWGHFLKNYVYLSTWIQTDYMVRKNKNENYPYTEGEGGVHIKFFTFKNY